jgi:7,8-dihydro-6-hydroxymethylpterin dimethyltransferase
VVETGVFGERDMIPLPCNPESISIGYGLRNGCNVLPLTSLIPQEQLLAVMPNTISPEKYPALKEKFIDLFSLSSGSLNTSERVAELLCCLPTFEVPAGLAYENVFRVTIVQFLDRFNFCVGNVKRSCIHFVTPKGEIIPFDTYNLFYRNGSIDGIRARMADDAVRGKAAELPR